MGIPQRKSSMNVQMPKKDFMGLTTWSGAMPTKPEAEIAKNYLTQAEIKSLNRIVSLYLDFAEMQAEEHRPMYMKDWINILDDFLRISRKDILTHAGKITQIIQQIHLI